MKKYLYIALKKLRIENIVMLLFHKDSYLISTGWIKTCFIKKSVDKEGKPSPWLTYPVLRFLDKRLNKTMSVYEFGSGNSTMWFSERVKFIRSIEHDQNWISELKPKLSKNVELVYRSIGEMAKLKYGDLTYCKADFSIPYISDIIETDRKFDIIIIDGIFRNSCIATSLKSLALNGILIIDNLNYQKEMSESLDFLEKQGFKLIEFWGMSPIIPINSCTGIFYKENNCLGI